MSGRKYVWQDSKCKNILRTRTLSFSLLLRLPFVVIVVVVVALAVMALLLLFTCFEVLCVGWRRRQGCCCRCSYCCGDVVFYGGVVGCSLLMAVAHSFPYFIA